MAHQESDQTYFYVPDRPWRFSVLRTTIRPDGTIEERAELNRPLFGAAWKNGQLLRAHEMEPQCWLESEYNCTVSS